MNQEKGNKVIQSFYRYQVLYFEILGLWKLQPGATRRQHRLHQLRFWLFFGIVAILLLFFAIRVLANINRLHVILEVFFMFSTEVSCMVKLLSIRLRRHQHDNLINEMHANAFRARNPTEFNALKSVAKVTINMRNCYCLLCLLAGGLLLFTQLFTDERSLPVSMYEPCNVAEPICYYCLYLYQMMSVFPTCWLNIAFDSMAPALLDFVRAQVILLSMRLENLGAALTSLDDQHIAMELRQSCIYYARIEKLRDMVEGFIKIPVSVQLLCSILVLVSNFYAMSINTEDTVVMIIMISYQIVMLLQIFIICYAASEVTDQSSLLGHALYSSEWITWNKENRKMCLLMMLRFNSPFCVRTLNYSQSFSLPTFASIVNCSYSYFALLKRVNS